jgi:hypothetical protein
MADARGVTVVSDPVETTDAQGGIMAQDPVVTTALGPVVMADAREVTVVSGPVETTDAQGGIMAQDRVVTTALGPVAMADARRVTVVSGPVETTALGRVAITVSGPAVTTVLGPVGITASDQAVTTVLGPVGITASDQAVTIIDLMAIERTTHSTTTGFPGKSIFHASATTMHLSTTGATFSRFRMPTFRIAALLSAEISMATTTAAAGTATTSILGGVEPVSVRVCGLAQLGAGLSHSVVSAHFPSITTTEHPLSTPTTA